MSFTDFLMEYFFKYNIMTKKIITFLLCALPLFAAAQIKLGHTNSDELIMAMPELADIENEIGQLQNELETQFQKKHEIFIAQLTEFQERESVMPENLRAMREQELIESEQRINEFIQQADAQLEQRRQELLVPVLERIINAVQAVGTEHGFSYIFDLAAHSIIFMSPATHDVTPLVKAKLGIVD